MLLGEFREWDNTRLSPASSRLERRRQCPGSALFCGRQRHGTI